MSHRNQRPPPDAKRRAVVAVQVAVMGTALIGFAALAIDVGAMYDAKGELQRTADAAAMAAAAMLGDYDETTARDTAEEYVLCNPVLGQAVAFAKANDVTFYRAVLNDQGQYDLHTDGNANSVGVILNHNLPLYFAGIFGRTSANVSTTAVAMLIPRDIAVVADLSGSHNDDSELRHYKTTTINLHEAWGGFLGGIDDGDDSVWVGDEFADEEQMAGPAWGFFKELGYGTVGIDASYDPTADAGLIHLPKYSDWNHAPLEACLAAQGYIPEEVDAIMADAHDSDGAWDERVAAALGLARWYSGMPGGLWEQMGIDPADAGNGNDWVGSGELSWHETFGERSISDSKTVWRDYINSYMSATWTQMYHANNDFRYRFGVKTFTNYLTERRPSNSQTPEFANTRQQPMQSVKEATDQLVATIDALESQDQLSLEIYGTRGRHEIDLTENYSAVSTRLNAMQAGYYDAWTNMGAGILRAREELASDRARGSARKVIFLLTDGYANVPSEYGDGGDYTGGPIYAKDEAELAAAEGIQVFCVSVGSYCDTSLMDYIADVGGGQHLAASGATSAEMSAQLNEIFRHLGGSRPVELIR